MTNPQNTPAKADVLLVNKIDLHEHIDFDIERVIKDVKTLKPAVTIFKISAITGEGMDNWCNWLLEQIKKS